jgi:hypothetical protein
MLSYLTSNASSSSSKDIPELEKIKLLKASLQAIPSGLNRRSRKRAPRKSTLVAKSYNMVASRPIANTLNQIREFSAYLRSDGTFITSSATIPSFGSHSITLSGLANSSIYTSCFDQYKFDEVEIWIEPTQSQGSVPTNIGRLVTCVDLDDATLPSSFGVVESAQSALVTSAYAGHYHKFVPHMAVAVYSGAFTSFANEPADWIDCASPSVQHYGLKGSISDTSSVSTWIYSVRAKVTFRQTL